MAGVAWVLDDAFDRPMYFPAYMHEMEAMRLSTLMNRQVRAFEGRNPVGIFCPERSDESFCRRLEAHSIGRETKAANIYRYHWKGQMGCADLRRALERLPQAEPAQLQGRDLDTFGEYFSRLSERSRREAEQRLRVASSDRGFLAGTAEYATLKELIGRVSNVIVDCSRKPIRVVVEVRKSDAANKNRVTSTR